MSTCIGREREWYGEGARASNTGSAVVRWTGIELIDREEPFARDPVHGELDAESLFDRANDLVGSPRGSLTPEAETHPELDRAGHLRRVGPVDRQIDHERTKVVADRPIARLRARPLERAAGQQFMTNRSEATAEVAVGRRPGGRPGGHGHPVIGRGQSGGERRLADPDVEQVDQVVAGRKALAETPPKVGSGQALRQVEVGELGVGRDAGRERCCEHQPRARCPALAQRDRDPGCEQGGLPAGDGFRRREPRRFPVSPEYDPPALALPANLGS
jgi:hypothetical protein